MHRMRGQRGFSLAEMIVAIIGAVVLIGGVWCVYLLTVRIWKEGSSVAALERTAGLIMDKIARGANGRFGLREADIGSVEVSEDGTSVTFTVDKQDPPTPWNSDDTSSRYYQDGNRILYDPDISIPGDEIPLNRFGDVEAIHFSQSGHVFTATLSLTCPAPRIADRKLFLRVKTECSPRGGN